MDGKLVQSGWGIVNRQMTLLTGAFPFTLGNAKEYASLHRVDTGR